MRENNSPWYEKYQYNYEPFLLQQKNSIKITVIDSILNIKHFSDMIKLQSYFYNQSIQTSQSIKSNSIRNSI